ITQTGALVVNGTTAFNSNGDISLGQANTFAGNVAFSGRNVTLATGTGDLSSSGTASGTLTETSAGAINQGGVLTVAGTTTLTANGGAGDITLVQGNAFGGNVAFNGRNVTLTTASGGLSSSGTAAGTLAETAAGGITQSGALNVTGGSTLTANAGAGDITLAQANTFGGNVAFSGHNVTLATGTGDLMTSGSAGGNLTETSASAITQGGALAVTGTSALTASGVAGAITLANAANALIGPITLSGGAVTLANSDATTLGGATRAGSLTLDAGGAVTFGTAKTDSTPVANGLIVQGAMGSGAAGGSVSEVGTLAVGGTTSIDAGANDIALNQLNTFGGNVSFAGRNVALTAGTGGLTSSGTASGNLTEIAKGPSSNLSVGTLSAGGDALLIAGSSILGTSAQATVTATNVEVRYGLENAAAQLGGADAGQQVGFVAGGGASQVQLALWLPAPGTQFQTQDLRQTRSDLLITRHPFVPGEQAILYSAPFGVSPGQVAGTLNAIQTTVQGTSTQTAGVAQGAATQGTQSVLYIDWGSYNPNVSLFGTLNPAVCLPVGQREDGVGSASGCTTASASLLKPPAPILVAMVPTRDGWKSMPLFSLEQ
ncbi:MAG: beta strand repeat-containing protein, partial [Steroidobacteraceae bacterium]